MKSFTFILSGTILAFVSVTLATGEPQILDRLAQRFQQQPQPQSSQPQFPQPQTPQTAPQDLQCRTAGVSETVTNFSWDLFKEVSKKNFNKNIVFNPTTVQYLLSILTTAAGGATKAELCRVVGISNPNEFESLLYKEPSTNDKNEYLTANGIFVDKNVKIHQAFKRQIRDSPRLTVDNVDFSGDLRDKTIKYVNEWAKQNTRGIIEQVLDPANDYSGTKMLLASAVYFSGVWRTSFRQSFYEDGFKISHGQRVQVPFMYQNRHYYSGPVQDPQAKKDIGYYVELPYQNNQFAMFIILPNENLSLDEMIQKIDMQQLMSGTMPQSGQHDVNVTMPKFKIDFSQSLIEPLGNMGLASIFTPQASFPYLLEGEKTAVSDMVQKAFIDVDEKGTRAAAVTTVNVIALSAQEPEETIQFTVDRPFLAIITLQANTQRVPLFISKVINPSH